MMFESRDVCNVVPVEVVVAGLDETWSVETMFESRDVCNVVPVEVVAAGLEDTWSAVNLSLFVVADADVVESKCAVHAAPNAS